MYPLSGIYIKIIDEVDSFSLHFSLFSILLSLPAQDRPEADPYIRLRLRLTYYRYTYIIDYI